MENVNIDNICIKSSLSEVDAEDELFIRFKSVFSYFILLSVRMFCTICCS